MIRITSQTPILAVRERERLDDIRSVILVVTNALAMPLYLIFWFADLLYAPALKWEFLGLRSLMIPVCLILNYLVIRMKTLRSVQWVSTLFFAACSSVITFMIYRTEGIASPYYAGLNLVAIASMSFTPWTTSFLIVNLILIFGPFYLAALFLGRAEAVPLFLVNTFFLGGTMAVTLVIRRYNEAIRKKEIRSRLKLENEVESRNEVIRVKTEEALKLATLTKQFSPQVVHAIKSGKIDIQSSIHRSQICALFIDIVNSTDKVVRINLDDVNRVISMYMADTMRVLLKYDITIDKFLGDGVLAFSNDPIPHDDYVKRTVEAALEIRSRIQEHQESYKEHWLSELQIRVGIATGIASVGFYGSDDYFKSYTAIGRVVNLASRLCSVAVPNQIIVSKDVVDSLPDAEFGFTDLGDKKLKGFESDAIRAFELSHCVQTQEMSFDVSYCPEGHGVLHLETDSQGVYVFKCRSCDFVIDQFPVTAS